MPAAKYWLWVAVDPFNAARWLLLGNSTPNATFTSDGNGHVVMADGQTVPLWVTTNAGASWAGITVPSVTVSGYGPYVAMTMTRVEWSDTTPGAWMAGWGANWGHDTLEDIEVVTRGSLTGATTSVRVGDIDKQNSGVAILPGADGDLVVRRQHDFGDDSAYLSYIRAGEDAYAHTSARNYLVFLDYPDRIPGSTAIVSMSTWGSGLWATPNYRTTDLTSVPVAASGYAVAPTKNAIYIGGGTGVQQVTDLFGTPQASTVAGTTISTGFARADRKTHTAVAALANDGRNPGVYRLRAPSAPATTQITALRAPPRTIGMAASIPRTLTKTSRQPTATICLVAVSGRAMRSVSTL